jgi:hypothetical protein
VRDLFAAVPTAPTRTEGAGGAEIGAESGAGGGAGSVVISVSYMQIYNDNVYDLLQRRRFQKPLQVSLKMNFVKLHNQKY